MIRRLLVGFGYVLVALFVVGLTFVLVAYGNDYAYDFATGKVVQRGHVIIESVPGGTRVVADGKTLAKRTPYQGVWSVGQHLFALERTGYRPWKKNLEVLPGQVSLVNYAIMVPDQPERRVIDSKREIVAQAVSKDHRHLAYIEGGPTPALYVTDPDDPRPVKVYAARQAVGDVSAEVLESVVWSDDATHLLVRSRVGVVVTYRLMNASGSDQIDLTDKYKFDFSGLVFSANNWRHLFWVSPDGLRRLDVDAQTVSAVLADKVSQFWVAPDRVLYVQQNDLGRSLWSLDKNNKRQRLIDSLVQSDRYALAYSVYNGQDELAIVPAATRVGTLYSAILSDNPTAKVVAREVDLVDFSPDGSSVAFSSPSQIVTYDLERTRLIGRPALASIKDQPGSLQQLSWFDNAHLVTVRDGRLYWCEYDGANLTELAAAHGSFPPMRSADFKSVLFTQLPAATGGTIDIVALRIRS